MKPETLALIQNKAAAKGDVLEVARVGGDYGGQASGRANPACVTAFPSKSGCKLYFQ